MLLTPRGGVHAATTCACDTTPLREAFETLRSSINSTVWKETTSVCTWRDVACGNLSLLTLTLNNINVGLRGSLPILGWNEIGTYLTQLTLSGASLVGSIPPEMLTQLRVLQKLDVSSSGLSGTLPNVAFGSMANLTITLKSNSQITGALPSAWATNQIQLISLSGGAFSMLPDWNNFGALKALAITSASSLTGAIPSWSNMQSIESISLVSCGFTGALPAWTNMPSLTSIWIQSCNALTGSPPASWQALPSLRSISISACANMNGPLPVHWSQHATLQSISLVSCGFTGTLPAWTNMPSLTSIGIASCNALTGSLPESWGTFPLLETISINKCTGLGGSFPESWGQLSNLQSMYLNAVPIVGPLPVAWWNMSSLKTLSIVGASLVGAQLPESWRRMKQLQQLTITKSLLGGSIPSWKTPFNSGDGMPNLTSIDLSFNALVGPLPEDPGWSSVKTLMLSNNTFSTTLPEWSSLSALQTFTCEHCGIIGPLPPYSSAALTSLSQLLLSNNPINATIPSGWGNALVGLTSLTMTSCGLYGSIDFVWPTTLTTLQLASNALSGGLGAFFLAPGLQNLDVSQNGLDGDCGGFALPSSMQTLLLNDNMCTGTHPNWASTSSLTVINLAANRFSGTIAPVGSSLLGTFNISRNQFVGTLPSWSTWQQVRIVDVSNNRFTGTLLAFSAAVAASRLQYLDVSQNAFSGTIAFLSSCTSLKTLNVANNRFNGSMPSLRTHTQLTTLNTSNNSLVGTLDVAFTALAVLDVSNNLLSGTVPVWFTASRIELVNLTVGNAFTGTIPKLGSALLRELDLSDLGLAGEFSTLFTAAAKMAVRKVLLGGNKLTGGFGTASGWSKLEFLNVSSNLLSGAFPTFSVFVFPPNLVMLDLSDNRLSGSALPFPTARHGFIQFLLMGGGNGLQSFSGSLPLDLHLNTPNLIAFSISGSAGSASFIGRPFETWLSSGWPRLESFSLTRFGFQGWLPVNFSSPTIRLLDLSHNRFNGTLHANYSTTLPQLEVLRLANNSLSGVLPSAWFNMTRLQRLDISYNIQLKSATLPEAWAYLSQLRSLTLRSCGLVGAVPESWSAMQSLRVLDLNDNQIKSSPLAAVWNRLSALETLDLGMNALTTWPLRYNITESSRGTELQPPLVLSLINVSGNAIHGEVIPSWWATIASLRIVDVSNNSMGVATPLEDWPILAQLQCFNASRNDIVGSLPVQWVDQWSASLEVLDVSHNNINGTLPVEWRFMSRLKSLSIQGNHLNGTLPLAWFTLPLQHFNASLNALSGRLPYTWRATFLASVIDLCNNSFCGPPPLSLWPLLGLKRCKIFPATSECYTATSSVSQSLTGRSPSNGHTLSWTETATLVPTATSLTKPLSLSRQLSASLSSSRRSKSMRTHSAATVTRTPLPIASPLATDPLQAAAGTTNAAIAIAATVFAASDISNANVQVMLAYLDCGRDSDSNDDAAGTLAAFVVSPFFSIGPVAMAYGNFAIIVAAFVCSALWTRGIAAVKRVTFAEAMEDFACQFPVHALRVFELWIPGCFFGLARAIALGSDDVASTVAGALAIPVALLAVAAWQWYYVRRVRPTILFRNYAPSSLVLLPRWKRMIAPTGRWEPFRQRVCYGPMFFSLQPRWSLIRILDIIVSCATSLLTAMSGLSGGAACTPVGWILAIAYLLWAGGGLLLQVHRLPFDNVANISVRAIFCVLCIFRAEGSTAPAILSFLQSAIMIVRACLVIYVRVAIEEHLELLPPLSDMQDGIETEMLSDPFPLRSEDEEDDDDDDDSTNEEALLIDVAEGDDVENGRGGTDEDEEDENSSAEEFEIDQGRVYNPLNDVLTGGGPPTQPAKHAVVLPRGPVLRSSRHPLNAPLPPMASEFASGDDGISPSFNASYDPYGFNL